MLAKWSNKQLPPFYPPCSTGRDTLLVFLKPRRGCGKSHLLPERECWWRNRGAMVVFQPSMSSTQSSNIFTPTCLCGFWTAKPHLLSCNRALCLGCLKCRLCDNGRPQRSNTLLFQLGDIPRISLNLWVFFTFSGTWTTLPPSPVRQVWSWTCGRPSTSLMETWMNWLRCWRRWAAATVTSPPWQRTSELPPRWLLLTTAKPPGWPLTSQTQKRCKQSNGDVEVDALGLTLQLCVYLCVYLSNVAVLCAPTGELLPNQKPQQMEQNTRLKQIKSELHLFFQRRFTEKDKKKKIDLGKCSHSAIEANVITEKRESMEQQRSTLSESERREELTCFQRRRTRKQTRENLRAGCNADNERWKAKAGSSPVSLGCTWWPVQYFWSLYRFLGNVLSIQLYPYMWIISC